MKDSFKLREIADWQQNAEKSEIKLPLIQRGFVWKTRQMEELWDSILRGYPVGSFLLSESGDKFYLMDGQQRSTTVFLGFSNPFSSSDNTKGWSIKGQIPVVWIDLKPDSKPASCKYSVRITTQSHPWGYQSENNEKKLSVPDRRKALELFRQHSDNVGLYTAFRNTSVFPYDSSYPIPLSFLIESKSVEEVIQCVEKYLPVYISTKHGGFKNKEEFLKLLHSDLNKNLKEIFHTIKLLDKTEIKAEVIHQRVLNEEQEEENPTLFVRLNSSGTPLTGDDLIYSIYKSMFPEAKALIDNIGLNFIQPTQVLSLASRIVASDLDSGQYVKKMSIRDFQRNIKNESFKLNLKNIIENDELKDLFTLAIDILSCKNNKEFDGEIPAVTVKHFINKNQELFLFFVYWLHTNKEEFSDSLQLRMVAKLLTFAWFEFENTARLWSEFVQDQSFWTQPLNELIWWDGHDGIHFLIKPELLKRYYQQIQVEQMFVAKADNRWGFLIYGEGEKISQYMETVKGTDISYELINEYFWKFIRCIQHNKHLVLLAQRNYINHTFPEFNQMDEIEDTNVPWDWDHIYPSEWVYRKGNCNHTIRDWNNTNGNLRAISLEENRSRGNYQAPGDLIDLDERDGSFIKYNDWGYWKHINHRIHDDQVHDYFQAVTSRTINIYEEFWNSLKIGELIKE